MAIVSGRSWKNMDGKCSQDAISTGFTVNRSGCEGTDFGGRIHVVEAISKKSGRVTKSSWSTELLSAVRGEEKGSKINPWAHEVLGGTKSAMEEKDRLERDGAGLLEVDLYLDAQDLIDSIVNEAPRVGDEGMPMYLQVMRDAWNTGRISRIIKEATEDMLRDGTTKGVPKKTSSRSDPGLVDFMRGAS
jgi:hypothetical protein